MHDNRKGTGLLTMQIWRGRSGQPNLIHHPDPADPSWVSPLCELIAQGGGAFFPGPSWGWLEGDPSRSPACKQHRAKVIVGVEGRAHCHADLGKQHSPGSVTPKVEKELEPCLLRVEEF